MRKIISAAALAASALISLPGAAGAADEILVRLTIKDHRFSPERLEVPAGQKVVMVIRNEDSEPEEFESTQLRREKIVFPGTETRVVLGRLEPGEYPFVGEYHEATAKGIIVAK